MSAWKNASRKTWVKKIVTPSSANNFKSLPNLLLASTDKLFEVDGIGRNRAQQLREYFDTLLKNIGFSYINGN